MSSVGPVSATVMHGCRTLKERVMMYNNLEYLLPNVIEWLEGTVQAGSNDGAGWGDQIGTVKECLYEMGKMAQPKPRPDQTGSFAEELPIENPFAENLNGAMPEVRAMLQAMQKRDRAAAIKCGKASVAFLKTITT